MISGAPLQPPIPFALGADRIVVGRPVTKSADPAAEVLALLAEIAAANPE